MRHYKYQPLSLSDSELTTSHSHLLSTHSQHIHNTQAGEQSFTSVSDPVSQKPRFLENPTSTLTIATFGITVWVVGFLATYLNWTWAVIGAHILNIAGTTLLVLVFLLWASFTQRGTIFWTPRMHLAISISIIVLLFTAIVSLIPIPADPMHCGSPEHGKS